MKARYVFPAYPSTPGLSAYSVLEARIGSLRLLVPTGEMHGLHLLAIITVGFGYLIGFILLVSTPLYQNAAPWRDPWVSTGVLLGFVAGFFLVLFWEEHSILNCPAPILT